MPLTPEKLKELAARIRAQKELEKNSKEKIAPTIQTEPVSDRSGTDRFGNQIIYNEKQFQAIKLGASGQSCIILGAAGTGKTTVTKAVIAELITSGKIPVFDGSNHKHLPAGIIPGVVCVSYTRRAVMNLRKNMSEDMKGNCITIHKLLEYEPVYYEKLNEDTGAVVKTMKFEPTRNKYNPLPVGIKTIIIDESSMVSVELFNLILDALNHEVQFIFLGDIQQLPPVFGSAILGYKMLELPTVELTEVYRQALDSPIIRLAHRILSGKAISEKEFKDWHFPNELKIHPWKKRISPDNALLVFAKFITQAIDKREFDPDSDMILCPFNKSFGTDEINKHIANHIARRDNKKTFEIIAGFNKRYFSVGDKVLYDKEDAFITKIVRNYSYSGKLPQLESTHLDYWGTNQNIANKSQPGLVVDNVDFMLEQLSSQAGEDSERVRAASHTITIQMADSGKEIELDAAAEINSLIMGYALTVHKSQGSEWRKVILVLHNSHATMIQRELLYTAVTRAKEDLYIICESDSFVKGIEGQRIVGNTLAEKAEFFKGKIERNGKSQELRR